MRLRKKLAYCQHDKGSGVPRAEEEPTAKAAALGTLPERGKPGPEFELPRFSFIVHFLPFLKNIRSLSYVPQTFCPFIIPHFIFLYSMSVMGTPGVLHMMETSRGRHLNAFLFRRGGWRVGVSAESSESWFLEYWLHPSLGSQDNELLTLQMQ